MQNPFSTTFSKFPESSYIATGESLDIIDNFSYEHPTESVYKIIGLRGSGKTVLLSHIQEIIRGNDFVNDGWLSYTLNPKRDMLDQVAAYLYKESFVEKSLKSDSITISANILGTGGGFGRSKSVDERFFDVGVEIRKMLQAADEHGKKILFFIDEVSKTPEMIVFALEFGGWLISRLPVYLVCTGLYDNVQEIGNVKDLTFFKRGTSIETKPLNKIKMAEMYRSKLDIDIEVAKKMADMTNGYAYAFQQLGSLYFRNGKTLNFSSIVSELKSNLFAYSYEKIWEELSREERFLVSLLVDKAEYTRSEILPRMGKKEKNYSVYRDRLQKKGVITTKYGIIGLNPPFFAEYVREYGMADLS